MPTQIFINLPVKHLPRAIDFYAKVGYTFNPQFTDEKATCMVVSDSIFVMLLQEDYFKTFITKAVADSSVANEVILCVSAESRAAVEALVARARAAGATSLMPAKDYGFMYQDNYQDLDGHLWEVVYMDEAAMAKQQAAPQ